MPSQAVKLVWAVAVNARQSSHATGFQEGGRSSADPAWLSQVPRHSRLGADEKNAGSVSCRVTRHQMLIVIRFRQLLRLPRKPNVAAILDEWLCLQEQQGNPEYAPRQARFDQNFPLQVASVYRPRPRFATLLRQSPSLCAPLPGGASAVRGMSTTTK